jgi:hypothetical protein
LAWIYDDYGDKARSRTFFDNQIPDEQIKVAEATRKLVEKDIGSYASYRDAMRTMAYAEASMKQRLGGLAANSFIAQWVPAVDAEGAEKSFFKINQSPTPVDLIEKHILKARHSAVAVATRAISHGGVGHKYWGNFAAQTQQQIEEIGNAINQALYLPPIGSMPIKTSDVPVGGRGYNSLPFVFDFVSLVNGVGAKDQLVRDETGEQTLRFLRATLKRIEQITTTDAGSLGLHPLVYFYTRSGAFQPIAFLAMSLVVKRMSDANQLDRFTDVRRAFEDFLMKHKEAITLIVKRQGSGARSRPAVESFFELILKGLWDTKDDDQIIESMTQDSRFSFFATPAPIREGSSNKRAFNSSVKSAAFVAELLNSGVRCAICGGLMHRNSMHTDHIIRKADGGGAHGGNAQVTHPYCNSTYKEKPFALASRGAA